MLQRAPPGQQSLSPFAAASYGSGGTGAGSGGIGGGDECCYLRLSYVPLHGAAPPAEVRAIFPPSTSASSFARSIWDRIAFPQPPDMPPPATTAATVVPAPAGGGATDTASGAAAGDSTAAAAGGGNDGAVPAAPDAEQPQPQRALCGSAGSSSTGAGAASNAATAEDGPPQSFAFAFVLDLPDLVSRADNVVAIRLLGPFSGRAGQRMCVTWLLTRGGAAAAPPAGGQSHGLGMGARGAPDEELLHYEVVDSSGQVGVFANQPSFV